VFCVWSKFKCGYAGVWCIAWLLIALSHHAFAAERYVRIEGTVGFSSYQGTNNVNNSFEFVCVSSPGKWTISSGFLPNAIEHFSFDRTNVYGVVEYTALATNGILKSPVRIANESLEQLNSKKFLTISPGPLPLQNPGINIVWLAFCSGQYLRAPNRLVPLPLSNVRHTVTAFGYGDETTLFDDQLGLPKTIKLRESVKRFAESRYDERVFSGTRRHSDPVPVEGRVAFTYAAHEATNYFGWIVPLGFSCEKFDYSSDGKLNWRTVGTGRVSSIKESTEPDTNPFGREPNYRVIDFRFRSKEKVVDSIQYYWTNSVLPSTNNPSLQGNFLDLLEQRPQRIP